MKNKSTTMKVMKPFVITTALMGSLFVGVGSAQPVDTSNNVNLDIDNNQDVNDKVDNNQDIALQNVDASNISLPFAQNDPNAQREPIFIDSLTLVNESLQQVLTLLEKWTDRVLVIGNNLPKATFNLNIPMPLSREEAISILKSVLAANGIGVTPLNDKALRIIPLNRAKNSSPEIIKREDLNSHKGSQEICCCLFRVNNLTAREAARIIIPWVTPLSSSVVTLDKANSLFITDYVSNLRQLDKIFSRIDKVGDVQESILCFTPKNASAESLKKNFEELQRGALKCYLSGNTSFAADKDTNLFVVITPKGNEPIINKFFEKLDVNIDPLIQHRIFRIQHGFCKEMTEIVKKLMQQQQTSESSNTSDNDGMFSKKLTIECDERLNAIVVYGTPSDIRQVEQLINQLDVVLPQVRIEVIIAEVKLSKGQASGLESFGFKIDTKQPSYTINGSLSSLPSASSGFRISNLTFPGFKMESVFNTAKSNGNISILSSPTLLTTHAREATLKITETRPYFSSIQVKTGSGTDPDVSNNTIERVDAGIELVVKPLIGLNGTIQMEIDQKVDNFTAEVTAVGGDKGVTMPHINRREAKSFISVKSGEMLVLGGLKQKEVTDQKKKMFLLGDLPLVGNSLFSSNTKEEIVKELIIFIRPFLLADSEDAKVDTEKFKSQLEPTLSNEVDSYKNNGRLLAGNEDAKVNPENLKEQPKPVLNEEVDSFKDDQKGISDSKEKRTSRLRKRAEKRLRSKINSRERKLEQKRLEIEKQEKHLGLEAQKKGEEVKVDEENLKEQPKPVLNGEVDSSKGDQKGISDSKEKRTSRLRKRAEKRLRSKINSRERKLEQKRLEIEKQEKRLGLETQKLEKERLELELQKSNLQNENSLTTENEPVK